MIICPADEDVDAPAADPETATAAEPTVDASMAEPAEAAVDASNGDAGHGTVPVPVEQSTEGAGEKAADASKKEGKAKKAKGETGVRHSVRWQAGHSWHFAMCILPYEWR